MIPFHRKLLPIFAITTLTALSTQVHAQDKQLEKVIAVQQATIASQKATIAALQSDMRTLQKKVDAQAEAFATLSKQVVLKDQHGRAIADYARTSGSASYADSSGTANSASQASICNRLRSEGGPNTIGVTWEGSSLFFNVDVSNKVKKL